MKLYLVVPCYNEEEGLEDSARKLLDKMHALAAQGRIDPEESRIVFINDGSRDRTGDIIRQLYNDYREITGIHFMANFGHQCAVLAGYHFAHGKCDACISIDADLQQDIDAIDLFLDAHYGNGYHTESCGLPAAFRQGTGYAGTVW